MNSRDKDWINDKKDKSGLSSLEERVLSFIRRYELVKQGFVVLTAVSGGADSVCLLLVLKRLEKILGIDVEAVTVNHGIRGVSAGEDVAFVCRLCEEYGIKVHVCEADVPKLAQKEQLSEEEAARKARYECFGRTAAEIGADVIAVAHHRDDNCETILHHLFRGSSLRGLAGMLPGRQMMFEENTFLVIRPFLQEGRREIENWLSEREILWRTDETNLLDDYTRNRLRHHVIPVIESEINRQAAAHVVQAGMDIAQAQALIQELAAEWIEKYGSFSDGIFRISLKELAACKPIVRREIFMQVCRKIKGEQDFKDMGHVHLEMLARLAVGETSRRVELPGGILAKKQYEELLFQCAVSKKETPISVKCPDEIVLLDGKVIKNWNPELSEGISFKVFSYCGEKIPENNYTKWFDYDRIENGLSLRTRRAGDYFLLDGGGRKTVKSYMIDQKIPADRRDSVLLLADGSHVLWISDGRISAAYKVSGDTQNVLEVLLKRGE